MVFYVSHSGVSGVVHIFFIWQLQLVREQHGTCQYCLPFPRVLDPKCGLKDECSSCINIVRLIKIILSNRNLQVITENCHQSLAFCKHFLRVGLGAASAVIRSRL